MILHDPFQKPSQILAPADGVTFSDTVATRVVIAKVSWNVVSIKKILNKNLFIESILPYTMYFTKKNSIFCFTRYEKRAKENDRRI